MVLLLHGNFTKQLIGDKVSGILPDDFLKLPGRIFDLSLGEIDPRHGQPGLDIIGVTVQTLTEDTRRFLSNTKFAI